MNVNTKKSGGGYGLKKNNLHSIECTANQIKQKNAIQYKAINSDTNLNKITAVEKRAPLFII